MLWGWLLGIISYIHYNSCWRSMICYKTDKWIYSKLESGDGPDIHPKSWISWIKVLNIYLEFCLWANSSQGGNMNDNIWEMSWCSIRLALFHQGIVPKTGTKNYVCEVIRVYSLVLDGNRAIKILATFGASRKHATNGSYQDKPETIRSELKGEILLLSILSHFKKKLFQPVIFIFQMTLNFNFTFQWFFLPQPRIPVNPTPAVL